MQFTVGSAPRSVTALGRIYISGNTGSHVVKLVNVSDGSDVPGGSVTVSLPSGTAGQFSYAPLASPVTLAANTSYYLVSQEVSGGDQWYDWGPVTSTIAAAVNAAVYYWPGTGFYQQSVSSSSYVPVNLLVDPRAILVGPYPGSALQSNYATFYWTPGTGASQYQLDVGTSQGSTNISSHPL
jgi:hypothetical protein